jgi:hypothetical protein
VESWRGGYVGIRQVYSHSGGRRRACFQSAFRYHSPVEHCGQSKPLFGTISATFVGCAVVTGHFKTSQ